MARLSDGGVGSRIMTFPPERASSDRPWTVQSYPWPDSSVAPDPDREMAFKGERLFWKETGCLAYGSSKPHPVDEEPLLVTWDEMNGKV